MIKFGTYNLFNYEGPATAGDRYGKVVEVIRGMNVDVLAVQELLAPDEHAAGRALAELGDAVGMTCRWTPGQPAVAPGHKLSSRDTRFHVGLLWNPQITPVPGTLRCISDDFWHGLAIGVFDLGGVHVAMAGHHGAPFGRHRRADEMERVVSIMTRPENRPPGLLGGDLNMISADRRPDGGYYDADPYADRPWVEDFVYQCRWETDTDGKRRHRADRDPGETLYAGGLEDAAAILDAAWEPTVGHWSSDPLGRRRIDTIKVTRELAPALCDITTIRTGHAAPAGDLPEQENPSTVDPKKASDHLPVVVTFAPELIDHP